MAVLDRAAKSLLLAELVTGMALTLKYFFKPDEDKIIVHEGMSFYAEPSRDECLFGGPMMNE